ncbi:MAG: CDP-diacylglycerol--glycerol-3-phosphate 3-phosphatidyltransferase [Pseudomonadota bacterium]
MIWTIPNTLTMARILAAPIVGALVVLGGLEASIWAFVIFVIAALTDFFDGWLARRLQMESAIGQMLDPIADKVMVTIVLAALLSREPNQSWLFLLPAFVILARETLVSGLREYLGDTKLKVTMLAKWKTTFQLTAIAAFLLADALTSDGAIAMIALATLWLAAILTAMSGWDYFDKGIAFIRERESGG